MTQLISSRQGITSIIREYYCIDPFTTTVSTPSLFSSIGVPQNSTYDINVYMRAMRSDGSTRNAGDIRGVFSRVTGNISQDGTLEKSLRGVLSTAQISFTINNTSHEVEIYANGLALTTINWVCGLEIIIT